MAIRCIALDMDYTTLDRMGRLSPGNRAALERAIQKGIHIVIASGRSRISLPADVLAVPGIEYAVTSNGAAVYYLRALPKQAEEEAEVGVAQLHHGGGVLGGQAGCCPRRNKAASSSKYISSVGMSSSLFMISAAIDFFL